MLMKLGQGLTNGCRATGQGGPVYLDAVIDSACCDLDATIAASYPGSGQTWANLIANPADGAQQADYDFMRGTGVIETAADPAFNGTAGDAAAYFSLDGGDNFTGKSVAATPTLYNIHKKTGGANAWWIAAAYRAGADTTMAPWGRGWNATDLGMYLYRTSGATTLYQSSGAANTPAGLGVDQGTDDLLLIVSADMEATVNNVRVWANSTTGAVSSFTWVSVSANTVAPFCIGAAMKESGVVNGRMAAGSRYYHFSCGNELLDDAKAASIIAHLQARHGRDYTP